ncbi:MAG: hypothetical protein LPL00_12890 [Alphaproteobacteria bacterium]|nr:hypothetical protein [Alphaproteobacteria bacterium]MDX5370728.1 hypothetical protein [Alphaproteobacteria bacterium]MDX5465145.1 hypothetical protein [Alphaproteobacteria bacterium]
MIEHDNALLWEVSFAEFLFVTVILAGGAAYLTGRAVALSWTHSAQLVIYMVLLAAATRFIHFALFSGTLLSLHYYVVDLAVLLAIGFLGKRITRAGQMSRQYSFAYRRAGPLGWSRKS